GDVVAGGGQTVRVRPGDPVVGADLRPRLTGPVAGSGVGGDLVSLLGSQLHGAGPMLGVRSAPARVGRDHRCSPDTFAQDVVDVDPEAAVSLLVVPVEDGADLVQLLLGAVALRAHVTVHAGACFAPRLHDPHLLLQGLTLCVGGLECAVQGGLCEVPIVLGGGAVAASPPDGLGDHFQSVVSASHR